MSAPLDAEDPTPAETALADNCIQLVIDAGFSDQHGALTRAGLLALPALVAMLDVIVDTLITEGRADAIMSLRDTPAQAFAVIRLLDADDGLQRRLLGEAS
jgi:hypothetical protein